MHILLEQYSVLDRFPWWQPTFVFICAKYPFSSMGALFSLPLTFGEPRRSFTNFKQWINDKNDGCYSPNIFRLFLAPLVTPA